MGKILAIDYGNKRVGIAITDSLQMIAFALTTVASKDIFVFLKDIIDKENVECIVIGEAKRLHGEDSAIEKQIIPLINHLQKKYPQVKIERQDERYTSKMAVQSMVEAGFKKKDRRKKENIDQIAATLILQAYLERIQSF